MSAPDYLTRLRAMNEEKTRRDGTAQTAKSNLRGLCSSPPAHIQHPAPPAPIVIGTGNAATDFDREWFEERAGILEFDAGFTRQEAERLAYMEAINYVRSPYFH